MGTFYSTQLNVVFANLGLTIAYYVWRFFFPLPSGYVKIAIENDDL